MSSPNSYTKRRSPPNVVPPPSTKSTNGGGFFYKSVLFALFLLAVPLFPSQAPDFVGETVLTKFWELIHLLFVGIAVAYGLFSRRNVESGVDLRMSRVDESSLSYVSRIFQVSSVFDEVFDENSCEFVDLRSESSSSTRAFKERESESFDGETSEYGKTNEVQAWNSKYFQGKSKVVVARPAYGLDGHVVHQSLGLPIRSLRSALRDNVAHEANSFTDSYDGTVYEKADSSLSHENFDEVMAAPASPEMMGIGDNYSSDFHPQSVDETQFETLRTASSRSTASSSSSTSSKTSFASHTQNRFPPSRSVSEESLNSNVEELVKEKSLQGSSLSSSPSLPPSPALPPSPPSPSLPPSPPSPQFVIDDTYRHSPELLTDDTHRHAAHSRHSPELQTDETHRRAAHSRHYSDGSLLEEDVRKSFEDELEENTVRNRRTELFSKKERGSKERKSTAESSQRGNRSRRSYPRESILEGNRSRKSYPPETISSPIGGTDDSTTIRRDHTDDSTNRRRDHTDDSTTRTRDLLQKSDSYLLEDNIRKGMEADNNNPRVKKGRSYDSLELTAEDSAKDEKFSESFPALDKLFEPMNAKASRRAMHSSRRGRDTLPEKYIARNLEDHTVDYNKSRQKDLPGNEKEVVSNSPRLEQRSWRASNNVSLRGKSVRTIRSDRHGKDVKTDGDSSDDRVESKVESRENTKLRRQRQEELAIVLHKAKTSEARAEVAMEENEPEAEAELQPQATFEEEEEAAWESQSNASHDHNEVDRKAGEFIAKFREQIRLQKLKSGEQPRGIGGGTSIIRNSHFR